SPPIPPIDGRNNVVAASPARIPTVELKGLVGFSSLPDQLVHKAKKNGFIFNIICVGETGIGKSTLIESLFSMDFNFEPCSYELTTVELRPYTFVRELPARGTENQAVPEVLQRLENSRLFVFHFSHWPWVSTSFIHRFFMIIVTLDVVALKELCRTTNVIPIIAKADTVSKEELKRFKSKILTELKTNGIEIYRFPEDDETFRDQNEKLNMQQKNDHTLAEYQAELHRLQEESKLLEKACADFQNRKTQFLSLKRKK
ncbi:unnamed protein product, partial [Soboliphyme baturini]|uniref:Septin-type G domain-containing protein n=1 Tax=Soboliphyme baturini TaxID=241478 RepID=A0A183IRM0_9BILA